MAPGDRVALAEAGYFAAPCATGAAPLGTLPKCAVANATGRSAASSCGDGQCWLELTVGGGVAAWVPDRACGAAAPRLLGEANATCAA